MGNAIYKPKGKAGEYARYACNFYVGCSNDCDYCYCKRGLLGHAMGAPTPTLKKCFKDYRHAYEVFWKELECNMDAIRQAGGLFFTFTSDPWLPETKKLTIEAVSYAIDNFIPCKILTKRADFIDNLPNWWIGTNRRDCLAFGFTLTGCDELERNASTNAERIAAMKRLHEMGFKTFASIEPVISINMSGEMITRTLGCCDLYKIGLLSGHKSYYPEDVAHFVKNINDIVQEYNFANCRDVKVYWKDSVLEFLKMDQAYRDIDTRFSWKFNLPHCVKADYDMFHLIH